MMNWKSKNVLALLLLLLLLTTALPFSARAAEGLTCVVEKEGNNVTISGTTFPHALVSLVVTRTIDGSRSYLDQTTSGADGAYAFSFALEGGDYRATVSCYGLHRQSDFQIKSSDTQTVTVRVEGQNETKLPQTEVSILAGETTLFQAITNALERAQVEYEVIGGLIHSIGGEEGWQWMINGRGGMHLPSTVLSGGEEIVLVDALIWNPVLTRLQASLETFPQAGKLLTVTLEDYDGTPLSGQPVVFNNEARVTDSAGQVTFVPKNNGVFGVTCEPVTANLIRPVPVLVNVSGAGGGSGDPGSGEPVSPGQKVSVSIRVEGYAHTLVPRTSISVDNFDLSPYLRPGTGSSAKPSNGWGPERLTQPTVAHAIVKALLERGIDFDLQDYGWALYMAMIGGEREFDIRSTSGWMYRVDGYLLGHGCQEHVLRGGEEIVWYFAAYGYDTWYSELAASKRSVKTGEEVTLTLTGIKNTSQSLGGATIYVNGSPYKPEGQEIRTDENGKAVVSFDTAGTYTVSAERFTGEGLRDMVRPVPVTITVSAANVAESSTPPGTAREKLAAPDISEQEILKTLKEVATYFSKSIEELKTAADAEKVMQEVQEILGLHALAAEKTATQEAAGEIAGQLSAFIRSLAQAAGKTPAKTWHQQLNQAAAEGLGQILGLLDKIQEESLLESTAGEAISAAGAIIKALGKEKAKEVQDKAIKLAEALLDRLGTQELSTKALTLQKNRAVADIAPERVEALAAKITRKAAELEDKLKENAIDPRASLHKRLTYAVPATGRAEIRVNLPFTLIELAAAKGIDLITVQTEHTAFTLTERTFGEAAKGKKIALQARKVDLTEVPQNLREKLPNGSVILELQAKISGRTSGSFAEPMEISIPYTAEVDEGKEIRVFLLKDNGTLEPVGGRYDPLSQRVTFTAGHFSKYVAMPVEKELAARFTDLEGYAWAREAIEALAARGIISGRGEGIFDPAARITRAEFAALVTRLLGYSSVEVELPFADVSPQSWYYGAVAQAYRHGLISGRSEKGFDPEGLITRQEMAAIIARALKQKGYHAAKLQELERFSDREEIASWARESVALCVERGIIKGMGDGTFAPLQHANRAQAAVMLYRLSL